jgi:hypothetical protein
MGTFFKSCNSCEKVWISREDFLTDPKTAIVGYQGGILGPEEGFFFINHLEEDCLSTLAIMVREFADLYDGPLLEKHREGSRPCPKHCFYHDNLDERPERCECKFVRFVMKKIKDWPKNPG